MAVIETITITIEDTSCISNEEAARVSVDIIDTLLKKYENDSEVTTVTVTFVANSPTVVIA